MEPKTKKILITTGIVGVLSLIAYKLIASKGATQTTTLLKPNVPVGTNNTPTTGNTNTPPPIEDMPVGPSETNPVSTTYTSAELADLLQSDFDGNGTNWSAGPHGGLVGVLLNLNSNEDFDNLNAAYGIRKIKAGFLTSLFVKPYVGDMNGAFNNELSANEIDAANAILAQKGIERRIMFEK